MNYDDGFQGHLIWYFDDWKIDAMFWWINLALSLFGPWLIFLQLLDTRIHWTSPMFGLNPLKDVIE